MKRLQSETSLSLSLNSSNHCHRKYLSRFIATIQRDHREEKTKERERGGRKTTTIRHFSLLLFFQSKIKKKRKRKRKRRKKELPTLNFQKTKKKIANDYFLTLFPKEGILDKRKIQFLKKKKGYFIKRKIEKKIEENNFFSLLIKRKIEENNFFPPRKTEKKTQEQKI